MGREANHEVALATVWVKTSKEEKKYFSIFKFATCALAYKLEVTFNKWLSYQ